MTSIARLHAWNYMVIEWITDVKMTKDDDVGRVVDSKLDLAIDCKYQFASLSHTYKE